MRDYQQAPLPLSIATALRSARWVAALTLAGSLLSATAQAQIETPRYFQRSIPSLSPVKVAYISAPALADLDADADVDVVLGDGDGRLRYFRRDRFGFAELTGSKNPFDSLTFDALAAPAIGDVDGDGDLDLIVGNGEGRFAYLENVGSAGAPQYEQRTEAANPLDGESVGSRATPFFVDLDADGDLDLAAGSADGSNHYFLNTTDGSGVSFARQDDSNNPLSEVAPGSGDSTPAFADIDDDGDFDLINGGLFGSFATYRNIGTPQAADFEFEAEGPFSEINLGLFSKVAFADIDRDGDLDVVTGEEYGEVILYRNIQSNTKPVFVPIQDESSPFFGIDVGYDSVFALADLDGDGDLDGAYGNRFGNVDLLENRGTFSNPIFADVNGGRLITGGTRYFTAPAFVDLDRDGDSELVVGDDTGRLRYFENDPGAFEFSEVAAAANPFADLVFTQNVVISFGDLDADGDIDAVTGSFDGTLLFLENTGDVGGPADFQIRTDVANPFDGLNVGSNSAPSLVDLDEDGDLDILIGGESLTTLLYAENTGTAQAPVFVERTTESNPFSANPIGRSAAPLATDLNGDQEADFLLGQGPPSVVYLLGDLIFADGFEDLEGSSPNEP